MKDPLFHARQVILKVLKARGLNQSRLAELVGITSGNMSKYLSGKMEPSVTMLARMAQTLQVPLAELFTEPGDESPRTQYREKLHMAIEPLSELEMELLLPVVESTIAGFQQAIAEHGKKRKDSA